MATTLEAFKKANKLAKERMAARAGYENAEKYRIFLLGIVPNAQSTPIPPRKRARKPETILKTVHNVHVLDVSGSMNEGYPSKISIAVNGINAEIEALKKDNTVKYTNTLICFSVGTPDTKAYMIPIEQMQVVRAHANGGTALHDAIGETITRLRASKKYDENVLIKVFTDGGENSSRKYTGPQIQKLIGEVESEGITVAFVGTEAEVAYAVNSYGVHASNTFTHDNTVDSLQDSFLSMSTNTMNYSKKLRSGIDVKRGFFEKKIGKL